MIAESTPSASQLAYQNLRQALVYERKSINDAYDSLLGLVDRNLRDASATTPVTHILHGLTGMLRFIFERLYQHTSETALTFVKEIGVAEEKPCLGAVAALHDAIKAKLFALSVRRDEADPQATPAVGGGEKLRGGCHKRYVFAVSSHYDWGTKLELLETLIHKLNHTTVVLQRCEASKEPSLAQQLGCNVLVSPLTPTAPCAILYATKEKLLQYANPSVGDEVDDELDALLHALDVSTRSSTSLTEAATVKSPFASAPVVSRNALLGDTSCFPRNSMDVVDTYKEMTWQLPENNGFHSYTQGVKRCRVESLPMLPAIFTASPDSQVELSQVIHYQREPPSKTAPAWDAGSTENFLPNPSQWRLPSQQFSQGLQRLR
ncbi:hypothetical protein TRSC58_02135 [Trypanosoma rangeli SC58]|uniref:Uncharacterized protein n=1 Tax=Trypanosoma rangeli SC58 TaxID=429131 RepID=A0A061J7S8_TRYRA|nr:hypothetical protein TRSC58_02135 [Trypanosoma rangeli SC58]